MRRLVGILVHNWPLKVAAVVLATLLYAGLVLSENAQIWRGHVAITPLRQPPSAVIVGTIPDVTSIHYFAPTDIAAHLSTSSFSATIDLSNAQVSAESPYVSVKVDVVAADSRVQILDFEPQVVRVQLDPLVTKTVPVQVQRGAVPAGLTVGDPVLSSSVVTVSGPDSVVRLVAAAQARVLIQPSGLDVDQQVDLVAVDASGNVLTPVDLEPATIRVQIRVGSQLQTKTLPVNPLVMGTPATGYEVASISVSPPVVLVEGEADALATPVRIDTVPLSITGAQANVQQTVDLALPGGVSVLGSSSVQVVVRLRAVTGTRTLPIGVVTTGGLADRTYDVATGSVQLTLGGPAALLDSIDGTSLVATADVFGLALGTSSVDLRVVLPRGVTLVSMTPSSVAVTVSSVSTGPTPAPSAVP
jgi:YbbR domain-containing protein